VLRYNFSEFGRRIKSIQAQYRHGAAAYVCLRVSVESGVLGKPAIPVNAAVNDNIPMQYDFRSVYSILEKWFCLDKTVVAGLFYQC
jgi:hypothetical protein